MRDDFHKLSRRINRLRWQVPLLAFVLVLIDQLVEHTGLIHLPGWGHLASQVFFYGLIGSTLAWWALNSLKRQVQDTQDAQDALQEAHTALGEANQRLEFLIRVSHQLAQAEDEETLVEILLGLPAEVVPAAGCTLIHYDTHGHPLSAVHSGSLEPATFEAWTAHLSATGSAQPCQNCSAQWATDAASCPLLMAPPSPVDVHKVYCLPLAWGSRKYGVLAIYLPEADRPDDREQALLAAMANEMALALESHRLRGRELAALYRLEQARRRDNLPGVLTDVLAYIKKALEADGGALFVADSDTGELDLLAEAGSWPESALDLLHGLVRGVQQATTPLMIGDLVPGGKDQDNFRSLLIAPLSGEDRCLGGLTLWAARPDAFTRRQVRLLATVAGQVSLLVENHRLYLEEAHQAALAERARLGREIHDGLAQKLGYLKLRTAQVADWLGTGEVQRASASLQEIRHTLAEAYVDAREAIDGLCLEPGDGTLGDWVDRVLRDFESLSAIRVVATPLPELTLPPEAQSQLLRIMQEALSNIRKHSGASQVFVEWQTGEHGLILRIADDGRGFEPADVPPIHQHGLRMMRERAELLDADFQIISRPGTGAQVVIRLPVKYACLEKRDERAD